MASALEEGKWIIKSSLDYSFLVSVPMMDVFVLDRTIHLELWVTAEIFHLPWVRPHFSLERNVILFLTFQKVLSDSVTFTPLWSCTLFK